MQTAEGRASKAEFERILAQHGQQHLLRFWDDLSQPQQQQLAAQIEAIDFAQLERLVRGDAAKTDWAALTRRAQPPDAIRLNSPENRFSIQEARAAGEAALCAGKIGVILVAGGQGTRLGFNHPKGMYSIGPVSGASLFQIFFEKLIAIERRYGRAAPLYVMTSDATHAETEEYFREKNYFGFAAENVRLFRQGTMPAVDTGHWPPTFGRERPPGAKPRWPRRHVGGPGEKRHAGRHRKPRHRAPVLLPGR